MPTYQYECESCGNPLEVVQSFSDDALSICPSCNEPKLKKVYGSVGVVFKGSGFYKTDSRSSGSTTAPTTSTPSSTGGTATPTTSPSAPAPAASPAPAKTSTPK